MKKVLDFLKKSVLFENPALLLLIGITPLLASSKSLIGGVCIGVASLLSLLASSALFYLLKKKIPANLTGIIHLLMIALVVSVIEILISSFLPSVGEELGIYIPLIALGGFLFPNAEKFSSSASFKEMILGALSCGIGYLAVCVTMSFVRELFGAGKLAGFTIFPQKYAMSLLLGPAGGFILLGILVAVFRKFFGEKTEEEGE